MRSGESVSGLEVVRRRKDGSRFEATLDLYPVRAANGEIVTITAITRSREASPPQDSHLQHFSEQRLALARRTGRMGLWEWNIKTDRAYWSAEVFDMTGMAPSDSPGTLDQFLRHVFVEDRAHVLALIDETCRSGCDFEAEFRVVRRDGELRWFRNMGQLLRDEAGAPACLVGIGHDVTERRGMEEALRASEESRATT